MAFNLDVKRPIDAEQHLCMIMGVLAPFAVVATYRVGINQGRRHLQRISTNRRGFQGFGIAVNRLIVGN
jgi:hypothetical protein